MWASRIWKDDDGQDVSEYAMLVTAILIGLVTVIAGFREPIIELFQNATNAFPH